MSESYIGEIRIFAGNFAPQGWALCNGALLSIAEYDALFTLIGTIYGGDGVSTFQLPDLRGRVAIHQGGGHIIGEPGGTETVTLSTAQIPAHPHPLAATTSFGTVPLPTNAILAQSSVEKLFIDQGESSDVKLNAGSLGPAGQNRPHENRQPYIGINFIISLYGTFPYQG